MHFYADIKRSKQEINISDKLLITLTMFIFAFCRGDRRIGLSNVLRRQEEREDTVGCRETDRDTEK